MYTVGFEKHRRVFLGWLICLFVVVVIVVSSAFVFIAVLYNLVYQLLHLLCAGPCDVPFTNPGEHNAHRITL